MRIAVIHHIKASDYAEYLSALVNSQAMQKDFAVKVWSYSIPASQQYIPDDAVVYIIMEANSRFWVRWWYAVKLPAILKKIGASAVLDLNGITPVKTILPKITAFPETFFAGNKQKGVNDFAKQQLAQSISNTSKIVMHSADKASAFKNVPEKRIEVIPFTPPSAFRTFEWHEKIMIKAQQADNKEYFIAVLEDDAEGIFVRLLKAFTKFKAWQQSSMQLLILPKFESFSPAIRQKHGSYKYREDVRLLEDLEESQVASVLASAYGMVLLWAAHPDLVVLTAALQCSLPVISLHNPDVLEYAGDAAVYVDDETVDALSAAMIQLYKDEDLHGRLKEAGKNRGALLNRNEYEMRFWRILETAACS